MADIVLLLEVTLNVLINYLVSIELVLTLTIMNDTTADWLSE